MEWNRIGWNGMEYNRAFQNIIGLFIYRAFQSPITSIITLTYVTDYLSLHQLRYYFPNYIYPNPPEKTHDFRQSVDQLFSHESVATIEPTNSEVKSLVLTTAPPKPQWNGMELQ
jgi:hypothetical protein